jgi:CheY-like chemotaxis protein
LRRSAWAGASLAELASQSLSPFRSSGNIEISGAPVRIVPELAQSMALIFHELATNAIKHGALSKPLGYVKVSWTRPSPGQVRLVWQEAGGPGAAPPTRKGFGLTVLQTAASDLGAVSNCHFGHEGFVYTLQGPFESVLPEAVVVPFERTPEATCTDAPSRMLTRILIVEDEGLIALQLQEDVEGAGHQVVGPARSLRHGLMLASQERIDAALLDVSLGQETSAPIAEQLLARAIPFAFTTGYADNVMLPEHLRQIPRLSKPYIGGEIVKMLERLLGGVGRMHKIQAADERAPHRL